MQGPGFRIYEIMWKRGPRDRQSGEPVQLMTSQLQRGAGKQDKVNNPLQRQCIP